MVGGFIIPMEPICGGCHAQRQDVMSETVKNPIPPFGLNRKLRLTLRRSGPTDHAVSHHACGCGGGEAHDRRGLEGSKNARVYKTAQLKRKPVLNARAGRKCLSHHGDGVPGRGGSCFGLPVGAPGHPLLPRLVPVDVAGDEHTPGSKRILPTLKPSRYSSPAPQVPYSLFHGAVPNAQIWKNTKSYPSGVSAFGASNKGRVD